MTISKLVHLLRSLKIFDLLKAFDGPFNYLFIFVPNIFGRNTKVDNLQKKEKSDKSVKVLSYFSDRMATFVEP